MRQDSRPRFTGVGCGRLIGSSLRGLWPKPVSSEGRDRRKPVGGGGRETPQNARSSIVVDKRWTSQRQRRKGQRMLAFRRSGAEGGIRTPTFLRTPAPQA